MRGKKRSEKFPDFLQPVQESLFCHTSMFPHAIPELAEREKCAWAQCYNNFYCLQFTNV